MVGLQVDPTLFDSMKASEKLYIALGVKTGMAASELWPACEVSADVLGRKDAISQTDWILVRILIRK